MLTSGQSIEQNPANNKSEDAGSTGGPCKKRIVIKMLPRRQPPLEDIFLRVKTAITALYSKQPPTLINNDPETLYQDVEYLCKHNSGAKLYHIIQSECEAYVYAAAVQPLASQQCRADTVVFLSLLDKSWQDLCDRLLFVRSRLLYIDLNVAKKKYDFLPIFDMGLRFFRKHFCTLQGLKDKTVRKLLMLVEQERLGEAVDKTLVTRLLKMFTSIGIYSDSFEEAFLESSDRFYASEGGRMLQTLHVSDYLKHVEKRLTEEQERCSFYLPASTKKPLVMTVEKQLLKRRIPEILEKGFDLLLEGHCIEDLRRLYTLFSRVDSLESIRTALKICLKTSGEGIVLNQEKDEDMISFLLEFKSFLDTLWEDSFCKNKTFGNTIHDAFKRLINIRQNRSAELIAKFIDEKLYDGNKGESKEEFEGILDRVVDLFRFIQDKDVFEAFYRKGLAKRILLRKSASVDADRYMISNLKRVCGSRFSDKLERMIKDIELSEEINESFKQSYLAQTKLPVGTEIRVSVLSRGHWPTCLPMDVKLPREMITYQNIFKEFYLSKHPGRRLRWHNYLGNCVLKADFPQGKKELEVSILQAVVLMLFNDADTFRFQDIKDSTGIEDKELRMTLQSLACGIVCILRKEPKGKDVGDDDLFLVDESLTSPLYRIKLNAIQMKELGEEDMDTVKIVLQDRQHQIDAAIVRVMKSKKVLNYTQLINELYQQVKFPVESSDIKKRIQNLIERDFLQVDKSNPFAYKYLP